MKKYNLDEFHYHEMLDRSYMLLDTWHNHISKHPVAKKNKKLRKMCEAVEEAMADVYLAIPEIIEKNEKKGKIKKSKSFKTKSGKSGRNKN